MDEEYDARMPAQTSGIGGAMLGKRHQRMTLREQLQHRKEAHQEEITEIDKALALLEKTPEMEDLLNSLNRIGVHL